ncbi:hypothetical protein [Propionicimonas sp.]|uniref:hypothetical protein n=1 Tax=Propionicimonas sp. TaxID=1955623 RepID=UPI0018538018|nr:hypothetical protein [Propionicimonas sp.]MBU3976651.1 hypothetical protein [Actinomycetota bacterium]MBA3020350.1 hypothetical protein [Propionicimonas sp.]MBU3986522.1 hypothetical protein [Actinomycetota bacterium]MBU4007326.1 hypothetical protein [Actinomycetota bacterium]MBU4065079.1 hypothetical protein [Actinomycetota bacterium]
MTKITNAAAGLRNRHTPLDEAFALLERGVLSDQAAVLSSRDVPTEPDWAALAVFSALPARYRADYDLDFLRNLTITALRMVMDWESGTVHATTLAEFILSRWLLDAALGLVDLDPAGHILHRYRYAAALGLVDMPYPGRTYSWRLSDPWGEAWDLNSIWVPPQQWFDNPMGQQRATRLAHR